MIQLWEVIMILEWYRQGMWVSAITRQSGLDRKTVRKYIQAAWRHRNFLWFVISSSRVSIICRSR
jgi:transposase